MPRFVFRLKPVLEHRERIEKDRLRVFSEKQRALFEAREERERIVAERDTQRATLRRDHKSLDADTLRATYAHLAYLDRSIEEQDVRIEACVAEENAARVRLVAASKDREVLETLKTRRREAFDAQAALVEQRGLDDQNARQFSRVSLERGNQS
jgi:flagellar export protein FliJ